MIATLAVFRGISYILTSIISQFPLMRGRACVIVQWQGFGDLSPLIRIIWRFGTMLAFIGVKELSR